MNSSAENFSASQTTSDSSKPKPLDNLVDLLIEQVLFPNQDEELKISDRNLVSEDLSLASNPPSIEAENPLPEPQTDRGNTNNRVDRQYPDIEVEIESQTKNLTLNRAVEFEGFLRQTVSETTTKIENVDALKQLETLDPQANAEDIADTVNTLIPLIVEMLQYKLQDSQTEIIETVRPVINRLIEERIAEDSQKMATAIAPILPSAISQGINLTPEAIAKAIAPEIALSIAEQIRLDSNSISQTLGPEMGKAIKAQIELERDAMVDALYPVIGSTISKYMVEVVRDINSKVESTLSPQGIKRKIQAKIKGVSEAELIFQESVGYRVRAIFLIAKDSGLIIQEIQQPGEKHLDSDLIAGMLTAIRSFANDCITSGSELNTIDYGDWQIPLEVAGYCYLAVVVKGEPSEQFRRRIRKILGEIVLEHGDVIQNYDGNLASVPPEIETKLELLNRPEREESGKSSSPSLLWLVIFFLGAIFIPWGIVSHRAKVARAIEQTAATELDAAPELSVYRLDPKVSRGKLTVGGRVPSQYLRNRAATITQRIAEQNNLTLDNRIVAVDVPVNPSSVTGEIERLTDLFNQQSNVAITTNYQPRALTVAGFILDSSVRQEIAQAFSDIPGVDRVIYDLNTQLPVIEQRIYFESGSTELNADNSRKVGTVKRLLDRYPQLYLKLIAHSDGLGSIEIDRELAEKRCQTVKTTLVAAGIEPDRVIARCNSLFFPANTSNNEATRANRYVSFELFIPTNLP